MLWAVLLVCNPDPKLTLCLSYLPPEITAVSILNEGFLHTPSQTAQINVPFNVLSLVPYGHDVIQVSSYNSLFYGQEDRQVLFYR